MNSTSSLPTKKSPLAKLITGAFVLGLMALIVWKLPRGYSNDLTQIGQGKNIVVQVHDHDLVNSAGLMDNLNKIRNEYKGIIEFVVADLKTAEGQAFAQAHNVEAVTLVFFAPDGSVLGTVQGVPGLDPLRGALARAFNLPAAQK
jgi:thioredoxin-like negative regulator of GroEL